MLVQEVCGGQWSPSGGCQSGEGALLPAAAAGQAGDHVYATEENPHFVILSSRFSVTPGQEGGDPRYSHLSTHSLVLAYFCVYIVVLVYQILLGGSNLSHQSAATETGIGLI